MGESEILDVPQPQLHANMAAYWLSRVLALHMKTFKSLNAVGQSLKNSEVEPLSLCLTGLYSVQ